jgi:hypothetical protein
VESGAASAWFDRSNQEQRAGQTVVPKDASSGTVSCMTIPAAGARV